MKKLLAMLVCLAVLMSAMTVAASTPVTYADYEGEVVNVSGDFEGITSEELYELNYVTLGGSLVTDAEDAHSGTSYLTLPASSQVSIHTSSGAMPEGGYLVQGYYKYLTDGTTTNAQIFFMQINADGAETSTNYNNALIYTNTWTRFGIMMNANKIETASGKTGNVRTVISNLPGCATLCLDDIEIVKLDNYDKRNAIQNPGFELNDLDTDDIPQHHYASWFNNGSGRLVNDAHSGDKALKVTGGNFYTWYDFEAAPTEGIEFSAWVKWSHGDELAAGTLAEGVAPPSFNAGTAEGNVVLTAEHGLTSNDWSFVKVKLSGLSAITGFYRLFLGTATDGVIWDDISIKPINATTLEIMDGSKIATDIKVGTTYEASAQYVGEGSAMLYIVQYDVIDGYSTLKKVSAMTVANDGCEKLCKLSVDEMTENTVIKGFLWDGTVTPIEVRMIK